MKAKKQYTSRIIILLLMFLNFNIQAENKTFGAACFEQSDTPCEWGSAFVTPTVNFTDYDGSTIGSQVFHQQIANPQQYMQQRCLDVAKILYRNSSDVPAFQTLTFELKNEDFVAYKWGDGNSIGIAVSTQHLANVYYASGNSAQAVEDEIAGILFHEVTHGYNKLPVNGGGYNQGTPFWAYTEGIADAVRIHAGYHQTRNPYIDTLNKWLGGYTTTGFFLHYVSRYYDRNFLYKFNKAAQDLGNSWSFENSFQYILNEDVNDVWDEYAAFINGGNTLDYDGNYTSNLDCDFALSTPEVNEYVNVEFYPNPVLNTINIKYNDALQNDASFKIVDLLGKIVLQGELKTSIQVNDFANGMYILIIENQTNRFTKRFIKS